ncbi:MAG: zinc ribbon domain-containing protein [Planctomycetota bacterium]
MTPLVVKLVLTVVAVPAAWMAGGFVASALATVLYAHHPYGGGEIIAMSVFGMVPVLIIGAWALIWRRHIRWTRGRRLGTWGLVVGGVLFSVVTAAAAVEAEDLFFVALLLYITFTPALAALIWRGGPRGDRARLRAWIAAPTAHCPYCDGNLIARRAPLCPYCGGDLSGHTLAGEHA